MASILPAGTYRVKDIVPTVEFVPRVRDHDEPDSA